METGEARYGSEKTGLLYGYLFRPDQPGEPVEADDACDRLMQEGDAFVWLHFNLANQASIRWLRQRLSLPESFDASLQHAPSTRIEVAEGSLVAVINDVTMHGLDASNVTTMTLCVDSRMMVSARHTPLRAVERLRASVKSGEAFRSAAQMLAHLLRDQADVLVHIVRDITGQVDRIEDRIIANQGGSYRARLGGLRRVLVRLQRLLSPEPSALFRLLSRPPGWITDEDRQDLRQSVEELAAAVTDSVALVERVRLLQEELVALLNEQTNRTLFVLTASTVIALPMTIIPGLFGMNVGGVPLQGHVGFWIVAVAVAGLAGFAGLLVFRNSVDS